MGRRFPGSAGALAVAPPTQAADNIGAFFESLAPLEFTVFDPHTYFESGNKVMALTHIAVVHKPSGKKYDIKNEGHLWYFDGSGKVTAYEHVTDTATHIALSRGE